MCLSFGKALLLLVLYFNHCSVDRDPHNKEQKCISNLSLQLLFLYLMHFQLLLFYCK